VSVTGPARGLSTAGAQFADVLPDPPDQLLVWLENPATTKGAHFARAGDDWEFWSYERLAELAHRVAGQLVKDGVGHNEVVTIVQRSSPAFIASLFGTMLAGAVPSPVAPPMAFQDKSAYREHVQALLGAARASSWRTPTSSIGSKPTRTTPESRSRRLRRSSLLKPDIVVEELTVPWLTLPCYSSPLVRAATRGVFVYRTTRSSRTSKRSADGSDGPRTTPLHRGFLSTTIWALSAASSHR
jgi:non-ribosomal peptide synthetase component F